MITSYIEAVRKPLQEMLYDHLSDIYEKKKLDSSCSFETNELVTIDTNRAKDWTWYQD